MLKKILIAVVICAAVGGATGYYLWNKKAVSNQEKKSDTQIDAVALAQEFAADEANANKKYLNKIIEVSGTITETENGQDGHLMIVLGNTDLSVQCAMGEAGVQLSKGQTVAVKGSCTGNGLMGVSLSDCYIVK
jgi:hypothetical protein